MGQMITFKRPDGRDCNGYLATPAGGEKNAAIVVIQEWWGLNDQIKGVAERFAALGYRALVPDLYKGKVTLDAAEASHLMNSLNFVEAATQDIRGAAQYLKQAGKKVGVVGFCMGGALTVLTAALVQEADAASSWYGFPPEQAADVRKISIPLQLHFAEKDAAFAPDQARALEARLREGKVNFESYWYNAEHAFGNETGPKYDAACAKLAWDRTLAFFARHIG
ncbi:MAG TPA: dienelactone hydrolase family protein [candidate division Zixibacteria bacterium]|nr:dienelactone hydrolase family protein [candidate division Zixibacteria bacterium]